ncbi:hypothetical protein BSR29_04670 [Boudabousia liubingyangii]|uniref:DUF881 domain-containing protein n=1 Tax=Boudabousia liubingyangii TaxID=1921764 RepID=A0A1Q5PNX0_9ACTO|nr:DUF881 domain-containing protein [Boudabousia liubingyangii]OKL49130.1 hypothetical protein BSR29_04670 [Boudabousia liubingyangii]
MEISETTETPVEESLEQPEEKTRAKRPKPHFIRRIIDLFQAPITLTHVLVAVLLLVFGFSFAGQFASAKDDKLKDLSQTELVTLLDELRERNSKLSAEQVDLQTQLRELKSTSDSSAAAQKAAEAQARNLRILAGTEKLAGPGVTINITDPDRKVTALAIVNVLGELRNARAYAIDLSGVRVVASTSIVKRGDDLYADGQKIMPPYRITALGAPHTLSVALGIPGGAVSYLKTEDAEVTITESPNLTIDSIREIPEPKYAHPAK